MSLTYTYPQKPSPEYFEWLRIIDDVQLKTHFQPANDEDVLKFLNQRINHLIQQLHGTAPSHTATLENGIEADEKDPRHWEIDYRFYVRLKNLFPRIQPTVSLQEYEDYRNTIIK